ncbi:hypothetical protein KKI90_17200, partial [Xenorhabdus bovienii]|uniref:hypothetical protein n=1 Tax=Xenorhabdus bovienii TaxID=40576 RepID=UPI00237C6455
MSNKPISLKQALYRAGLGISLFAYITQKAKDECEINLNNLIALAHGIHQEVHRDLLKHVPQNPVNKLVNCIVRREIDPLGQSSFRAGLCTSLYERVPFATASIVLTLTDRLQLYIRLFCSL